MVRRDEVTLRCVHPSHRPVAEAARILPRREHPRGSLQRGCAVLACAESAGHPDGNSGRRPPGTQNDLASGIGFT